MVGCGHCQELAPRYEALGKKFADVDNIVIAKFDAIANAHPEGVTIMGFPTLKFFPASAKSVEDAIEYEGDRSLKDLLEFVVSKAE